jgi:hypothetical protein
VAWEIHGAESGELAKKLIDRALLRERCWQNPPVLHSDNGAPMTSYTLKARLAELGILMSHSRPRVSNDNLYSKSLFKTLKYCPKWPAKGFRSLIAVRESMLLFEQAYNEEHLHSGINFVTPAQRHQGVDAELLAKREAVYERAKSLNPKRWSGDIRIGCRDHARRKFVEAIKGSDPQSKGKAIKVSKADVALSHINKLYAIERQIKELSKCERYRIRQELSVPRLDALKVWLEANAGKVAKGTMTRKAMDYTPNQWPTLVGYCERGGLQISNVLAENAIHPLALGRKAWLFADTLRGDRATATSYSLVETAKANSLEPSKYI